MNDKQIPELAQDWLEHVSVCTSQYDSTCRSLACELLRSRSKVKELECLRACDTLIIDWAQPRIAELRGQRDTAKARVMELEQVRPSGIYLEQSYDLALKENEQLQARIRELEQAFSSHANDTGCGICLDLLGIIGGKDTK